MVHVTVNSVPVEKIVAAEISAEYRAHRNEEVESIAHVIYRAGRRAGIRNHSGAKSGRGRVVYSVAMAGGAA